MFAFFKLDEWVVTFALASPNHQPIPRKKPLVLLALIGFQELVIAETRCYIVGDIQEFEEVCLETHMIVVYLDSELDGFEFQ